MGSFSLSQQPVNNADFIIPVEIDGTVHQVRTNKLLFSFSLSTSVTDSIVEASRRFSENHSIQSHYKLSQQCICISLRKQMLNI